MNLRRVPAPGALLVLTCTMPACSAVAKPTPRLTMNGQQAASRAEEIVRQTVDVM
ncbi:hypothetical protein ACH4U5_30490 [Streptomyces sp. NPDC020858]|uniref:hypothetical protein n=1 Tax=Streptomyces sp. NPDC020858 TaxID=3365097 RepID=UPI0037979AFA